MCEKCQFLCTVCRDAHANMYMFLGPNHRIKRIDHKGYSNASNPSRICLIHCQNKLEHFCITCRRIGCKQCVFERHLKHKTISVPLSIEEMCIQLKEIIFYPRKLPVDKHEKQRGKSSNYILEVKGNILYTRSFQFGLY